MDPSIFVKQVNGNLICTKDNHNQQIEYLVLDDNFQFQDALLCRLCLTRIKRSHVNKIIGIPQAEEMISESKERKNKLMQDTKLKLFNFQLMAEEIQKKVLYLFDSLLGLTKQCIKDLENEINNSDLSNYIEQLQLLRNNSTKYEGEIQMVTQSLLNRIDAIFGELCNFKDYYQCHQIFQMDITTNKIQQVQQVQQVQPSQQMQQEFYQQVNSVKQVQVCQAMAFNSTGQLMVAGCGNDLKIWKFDEGNIEVLKLLTGHQKNVNCIVFSKKMNWFASCSDDYTIRGWKEQDRDDWVSSQPLKEHCNWVYQLILNKDESQLISCSFDKKIIVWKVDCKENKLEYFYYCENKHKAEIYSISLNESETTLVSCSADKQIILWMKGSNSRWQYQNHVTKDDYGYRLCFIDDYQIAWQQQSEGFTHFLDIENGVLKDFKKKIKLSPGDFDEDLFPTIYNKQKQVLIQKYGCNVLIIKMQEKNQFATINYSQISFSHTANYGTLTNNGNYLVIWSFGTKEIRVYKLNLA